MIFSSDNSAPAVPEVMQAMLTANEGHVASYGADEIMARVTARIREIFEAPDAAVYLVPTGTAANALALATICPPWATIYCATHAHIAEDECAAPEFYTGGAKLSLIGGDDARMDVEALAKALKYAAPAGVHNVQRGAVSMSTVTEMGAVYSLAHMRAIADLTKAHDLPVHLDGARFANALVALGCTPAEMSWKAGVDVLSFGGTKNGLMGVEAVVFFNPKHAWEFELRRKRGGHLFSKHRYLSAQMEAYLADGLWLKLAARANASAQALATGLAACEGFMLLHPVKANMIFATWPRRAHDALAAAGAKYYQWPHNAAQSGPADEPISARLVTSWCTTPEEIEQFVGIAANA
ncbi:MAG: beta-eliminating lyase-related protein [Paracoccaceae bacterium]